MRGLSFALAFLLAAAEARADDITLADALAAAGKAPAAQVPGHEIAAADAQIDAAGAWPPPSVHVETNRLTARLVAGASLPLPLFGTLGAAHRSAAAKATVVRAEATVAIRDVRRRAALGWLALARAEGELVANGEAAKQAAELERIAKGKLDAGSGGEVDVTVAKAARLRAELAVTTGGSARDAAAAELAAVIGWDPAKPLHAAGAIPVGRPMTLDALRGKLAGHPDRAAALNRVAAASSAVGEVRSHRLPGLALDAQVSVADPETPGTDVLVGLTLELPLFSKVGAQTRSARATAAAERSRLAVIESQLGGALIATYHRWQAASERLTVLTRDIVPLQTRATAQSEQAYREGARELVTALSAERDLAVVRAEVNSAQIDAAAAWIELSLAAGGDIDAR